MDISKLNVNLSVISEAQLQSSAAASNDVPNDTDPIECPNFAPVSNSDLNESAAGSVFEQANSGPACAQTFYGC